MKVNEKRVKRPPRAGQSGHAVFLSEPKLLSAIAESMEDVVYIAGPDGVMGLLFGKWPVLQGMSAEEFVRRHPRNMNSGDKEAGKVHLEAHSRAAKGELVHYEWRVSSGGRDMCYQSRLIPLFSSGRGKEGRKEVCAILGVCRDVSNVPEMERRFTLCDAEVKDFSQELMSVREEEKRKVSSALHDELGSSSVAIMSLFGILEEDIKDGRKDAALGSVGRLGETVVELMGRLRHIAVDLRPPNLETVGLSGAVKDLIERVSDYSRRKIEFSNRADAHARVSDGVAITIYRVAQESLSNAIRHSGATRIRVSLIVDNNMVRLAISDNGKGFDAKSVAPSSNAGRIGILGMKESVEYIGGRFEIDTASGQGTVVKVACPAATYMG